MVRNRAMFSGVIFLILVRYARALKMPLREILPLVIMAVFAPTPGALPAIFTLRGRLAHSIGGPSPDREVRCLCSLCL